jgi:hypothetical protein
MSKLEAQGQVVFPLTIQFEGGEEERYESVEDLERNLEDFDSDVDVGCHVTDALGRPVRLKLRLLNLAELSVRTASS